MLKIKTKLSATTTHFLLSCFIFLLFIITLRTLWFPEPYFTASGGWQGLKIVAFIDIVLGPLLTFIVFNTKKPKKELFIDLSIIFALQISALVWGINTVYNQRPVAITFWENSFYTVPYAAVDTLYKNTPQLSQLTEKSHQFFIVPKPTTVDGINTLNDEVLKKQLPPFQLINRYQTIDTHFKQITPHSIDIHEIVDSNASMKQELNHILSKNKRVIDENYYIPLISKYQNIILVFTKTGSMIGYLKAPFKES